MEVSYHFFLGPVAVAGLITASRRRDGSVISPVNKSIELKPGLILKLTGPYEDNMDYIKFLKERFELNPDMDSGQAVEDLKWLTGLQEIDVQGFLASVHQMAKDSKRYFEGRMNEKDAADFNKRFEEIQNHPMSFLFDQKQSSKEELAARDLKVTHLDLIQYSEKGVITDRIGLSDVFAHHHHTRTHNDTPYFECMRIGEGAVKGDSEGKESTALGKNMIKYVGSEEHTSELQ